MNVDELTIGQAKVISSLIGGADKQTPHPLDGTKVVAVVPYGFVFFGFLHTTPTGYVLTDASNVRRWDKKDGGLPEFAAKGPTSKDTIDEVGDVYLEEVLFFYPAGFNNE